MISLNPSFRPSPEPTRGKFQFYGLLSPEGGWLDLDDQALAGIRLSREQIIGTPLVATPVLCANERTRTQLVAAFERACRGESVRFDLVGLAPEGPLALVDVFLGPQFEGGRVKHVVFTLMDVASRQKEAADVAHTAARLDEIERIAHLGHWDWNLLDNTMVCSDEIFRTYGLQPQEVAPTYSFALEFLPPADRQKVLAAIDAALHHGAPYDVLHRIVRRDGVERTVIARGVVYRDETGRPVRIIGTQQDVTDRERLKEEAVHTAAALAATLESTADGIMAFDCEGHLLHCNRQLLEMWRVERPPARGGDVGALREQMYALMIDAGAARQRTAAIEADPLCVAHDRFELKDDRIFERFTRPTFAGSVVIGRVCSFRDVTGQVRATAALQASEARFAGILNLADEAIITIDVARRIMLFNHGAEKIFGYAACETIGQSLDLLLTPEDHAAHHQHVARFSAGAEVSREMGHRLRSIRGRRKDGSIFPAEASITRLELPDGVYFTAILRDITERQRTEEALRESEERLRQAIRAGGIGIFDHDHVTDVIYWSPELRAIHGWAPDECVPLQQFLQTVHPDDREHLNAAVRRAHAPTGDGGFDVEYRMVDRDGRLHWLKTRSRTTFAGEGAARRPLRTTGAVSDITTRRQIEVARDHSLSLMRATLESTADGIMAVDLEGRIVIYNRLAAEMWGFSDARPVPATIREAGQCIADQLLEPGTESLTVRDLKGDLQAESRDTIYLKDARVFQRYSRPQLLDGQPIGRVVSFRDITAKRRAEEERAKLEGQFCEAQKLEAVGTLAGGIAHDFNNILTGILGYAQLAETYVSEGPTPQECVREIAVAARRAADLVQQLLAFSRQQPTERTALPLVAVVGEALRLIRPVLPSLIELRVQLPATSPTVLANATQVQQVILNLCTNARQAIGAHPGMIEITLEPVEIDESFVGTRAELRPGRYARLSIADNGPGMSQAVLDRIFEPFFTTKPTGEGSGLGLSAVHGIMHAHEGAITVTSAPGSGSTFHLYFPWAVPLEPVTTKIAQAPIRGHGEHILYVDDEPALVELVPRLLAALGYRVTSHGDPATAYAHFLKEPAAFDAAVLDFAMPKLTGLDLARCLRDVRRDLPVVIVTGHPDAIPPADLALAGVDRVLAKPGSVDSLHECLSEIFGKGRHNEPNPAPA